jgi:hypothetical protein
MGVAPSPHSERCPSCVSRLNASHRRALGRSRLRLADAESCGAPVPAETTVWQQMMLTQVNTGRRAFLSVVKNA